MTKLSICLLIIIVTLSQQSCKYKHKNDAKTKVNTALTTIQNKAKNSILVCAHRSYHREAPENSLLSIQKAIKTKIDFVELDVRTTKDSVMVLMHDKTIDRTTTGNGKLHSYTYKELQTYSLKQGDTITKEKIPLLIDALKLLKNTSCIPNLDLKAVNYKQLYKMLSELNMQHKVISFIGPKNKVMEMVGIDSLYATLPLSKTKEDVDFYITSTYSSLQHFTNDSFTPELMTLAKNSNQLIFINTLWQEDDDFKTGDMASMDRVIAMKPAIIQTDYPKMLVEYLRKRGLHD